MKIIIAEPTGHGKLAHYSFNLCQALAERGERVTLLTAIDYELEGEDSSFTIKRIFPFNRLSPAFYSRLFRYIRGREGDVLHFQWVPSAPFILFLLIFKRRLANALIYTAHNVLPHHRRFYHDYFYCLLYRHADKIIAHSQVDKQKIIALFKVDNKKIDIVPIGTSIKALSVSKGEARQKLGLKAEKALLFFGYITPDKGLDVLLKALRTLKKDGYTFKLLIAGKAENKSDVLQSIKRNGLSENVLLDTRYVPQDQASLYFRAADFLVLPYLKSNQSPLIPLAYSYGLPVVATSAQIEKVIDGVTGYLVTPGDAESLHDKLSLLFNDESGLREMSRAAMDLSEREYSWASIAAKTLAVYESAE